MKVATAVNAKQDEIINREKQEHIKTMSKLSSAIQAELNKKEYLEKHHALELEKEMKLHEKYASNKKAAEEHKSDSIQALKLQSLQRRTSVKT